MLRTPLQHRAQAVSRRDLRPPLVVAVVGTGCRARTLLCLGRVDRCDTCRLYNRGTLSRPRTLFLTLYGQIEALPSSSASIAKYGRVVAARIDCTWCAY